MTFSAHTFGNAIKYQCCTPPVFTDILVRPCQILEHDFSPFTDDRLRDDLISEQGFVHILSFTYDGQHDDTAVLRFEVEGTVTITGSLHCPASRHALETALTLVGDECQLITLGFTFNKFLSRTFPRVIRNKDTLADVIELIPCERDRLHSVLNMEDKAGR